MKSAATTAFLWMSAISCVGQTTLKELLSWLPPDTESVVGENGPFPLPDLDALGPGDLRQPELPIAELELRTRTLGLSLLGFKNGGLQTDLKGKVVALAVEGSRHFRPPAVLGGMRYEGCEIVVFGPAVRLDRDSFIRKAAKSAARFEDVAGVRIAVFEEPQDNDVWTTFVGFPRSNIVVVATDVEYLRVVLTRIKGSSGPRALPDTLLEWKYVDTRAPVWGLRHYQKLEASLDPTSPFSAEADGDATAVGLTFWFEPSVRRKVTVGYLSPNKTARQILQQYLGVEDADTASPREFQIRLRQPALGVIEGSLTLSLKEMFYRFTFGLMGMLGHALYL
jgi:hypothetical protein